MAVDLSCTSLSDVLYINTVHTFGNIFRKKSKSLRYCTVMAEEEYYRSYKSGGCEHDFMSPKE